MKRGRRRPWLGRLLSFTLLLAAFGFAWCLGGLVLLRWADPPSTAVQTQRRVEAILDGAEYRKYYTFVPVERISVHLRHAVIAAEDGRFYQHSGVDWQELEKVLQEEIPKGRLRGASTLTQQLVKNLFMTTHPNPLRKPVEFVLAPLAEKVLGKERILELYLNVVEWGPGIYGAEAASRHYYGVTAARLTREQAARLAACLPSPRRWKPQQMDRYGAIILQRMAGRGW